MKTGISVYFGSPEQENARLIERAAAAKVSFAFTSLQIPEERGMDYARVTRRLLSMLSDAGIQLIADVGPDTCEKLGVSKTEDLAGLGFRYIRLDYGFSVRETVKLSDTFHIVFNASTAKHEEIAAWRHEGADFSRFAACHNFYPKRYTGLSLNGVRELNQKLHGLGFETMSFVPGDDVSKHRAPLREGLPTVEDQRKRFDDLPLNMLELHTGAGSDVVLVGDPGLTEKGWGSIQQLSNGYVDVRCRLDERYGYLYGQIHHDRPDSSEYIFRSQESRTSLRPGAILADAGAGKPRTLGDIAVSNAAYGRYEGELEIARCDIPGDARMNVVGSVVERDRRLLPYLKAGFGLKLCRE